MKPKTLALTLDAATEEVKGFAQGLADRLHGELIEFYPCEPCVHRVSNAERTAEWSEGTWGAVIHAVAFSIQQWHESSQLPDPISIDDVSMAASWDTGKSTLVLKFALSARIADLCPTCKREADDIHDLNECQQCGAGICPNCEARCSVCCNDLCYNCTYECDWCSCTLCGDCDSEYDDACAYCYEQIEEEESEWVDE